MIKSVAISFVFLCLVSNSSVFGFFKGPYRLKYGANVYLHDPSGTIQGKTGDAIGLLPGLSLNASFIDYFLNDLLFYSVSLGLESAIPRSVNIDGQQTHNVSQFRVEIPLLLGVSFDFKNNKFYAAAGPSFVFYNLNLSTTLTSGETSSSSYLSPLGGATVLGGIMVDISPKVLKSRRGGRRFQQHLFLEIQYTQSGGTSFLQTKTGNSSGTQKVQVSLSEFRWNIGYAHTL